MPEKVRKNAATARDKYTEVLACEILETERKTAKAPESLTHPKVDYYTKV
jgi:hypothetical protein